MRFVGNIASNANRLVMRLILATHDHFVYKMTMLRVTQN